MHTLGEIAQALNRPLVYLHGLQARFELPAFEGAGYSDAYLAFLRTIVYLRMLNISEETLRDVWRLEKKLLQLLHLGPSASPTWFLDSCGQGTHSDTCLLLTNHDLGVDVPSGKLQLGLNFSGTTAELFAGHEMGEDALRVLSEYVKLYTRIQDDVNAEMRLVRAASKWVSRLL